MSEYPDLDDYDKIVAEYNRLPVLTDEFVEDFERFSDGQVTPHARGRRWSGSVRASANSPEDPPGIGAIGFNHFAFPEDHGAVSFGRGLEPPFMVEVVASGDWNLQVGHSEYGGPLAEPVLGIWDQAIDFGPQQVAARQITWREGLTASARSDYSTYDVEYSADWRIFQLHVDSRDVVRTKVLALDGTVLAADALDLGALAWIPGHSTNFSASHSDMNNVGLTGADGFSISFANGRLDRISLYPIPLDFPDPPEDVSFEFLGGRSRFTVGTMGA